MGEDMQAFAAATILSPLSWTLSMLQTKCDKTRVVSTGPLFKRLRRPLHAWLSPQALPSAAVAGGETHPLLEGKAAMPQVGVSSISYSRKKARTRSACASCTGANGCHLQQLCNLLVSK